MKIGLLSSNTFSKHRLSTLSPILNDNNFLIKIAIIDNTPQMSTRQKIIKNFKRGRGLYILIMALKSLFKQKKTSMNTEEFCNKEKIKMLKISIKKDIYSKNTVNYIKDHEIDILLLLGGFGIVKEPLLSAASLGILSYHHGDMRKYRGMPPGLWELYNGESEIGITVQLLSSGLDCGIPIDEKTIKINKYDTLKKLQDKASKKSINMFYDSLKKLSDNNFTPKKIKKFGRVYTLPNMRQWIKLNIKILFNFIR